MTQNLVTYQIMKQNVYYIFDENAQAYNKRFCASVAWRKYNRQKNTIQL